MKINSFETNLRCLLNALNIHIRIIDKLIQFLSKLVPIFIIQRVKARAILCPHQPPTRLKIGPRLDKNWINLSMILIA